MIRYTYLLIDLLTILFPLILSFHPNLRLHKHWPALWPAIGITGLAYVLWDSWFTHLGIWGFNNTYITGIHLGNLPVEEILFFVCIPYACLFTFECISREIRATFFRRSVTWFSYLLAGVMLVLAAIYHARAYTAIALLLPALLILVAAYRRMSWLPVFYVVYAILLIPFLIVNGVLTGTGLSDPIVWYSPEGIIGYRIITIPIEDVFYGMGLVMANIWLFQWLRYLSTI